MTWLPFPHRVTDALFGEQLLADCADEIPPAEDPRWRRYGNDRELKLEGPPSMWGDATTEYFTQLGALAATFADLFDLPDLTLETIGGGYHLIPPGGYLNVHTDFSRSPRSGRFRRVNVLTYLNRGWGPDDGGQLELWDEEDCAVSIAPEFGTTVAFVTSSRSWHGHPRPAARWRASLAGYFFTVEPPDGFVEQSTVWHQNGGRRA